MYRIDRSHQWSLSVVARGEIGPSTSSPFPTKGDGDEVLDVVFIGADTYFLRTVSIATIELSQAVIDTLYSLCPEWYVARLLIEYDEQGVAAVIMSECLASTDVKLEGL